MARTTSPKTLELEALLRAKASAQLFPGERFPSNRAIAARYGVSYQTAHRIVARMEADGLLTRSLGSGTYVARPLPEPESVSLLFNRRGRRGGSFGAHLHQVLTETLTRNGVPFATRWIAPGAVLDPPPHALPLVWECPRLVEALSAAERPALLLNEHAPIGKAGRFLGSLSIDNHEGGLMAAELFWERGLRDHLAVLGGPLEDERSRERIRGFTRLFPQADVFHAGAWNGPAARAAAPALAAGQYRGIFCGNDRIAASLQRVLSSRWQQTPELIGFDGAPVSDKAGLSTIAFPWDEVARRCLAIVQTHLEGKALRPSREVLRPYPIDRMPA